MAADGVTKMGSAIILENLRQCMNASLLTISEDTMIIQGTDHTWWAGAVLCHDTQRTKQNEVYHLKICGVLRRQSHEEENPSDPPEGGGGIHLRRSYVGKVLSVQLPGFDQFWNRARQFYDDHFLDRGREHLREPHHPQGQDHARSHFGSSTVSSTVLKPLSRTGCSSTGGSSTLRASAVFAKTTTSTTMAPKDKQFLSLAVVDAIHAQIDLEPDLFHVLELQELLTSSSASAAPAAKAAASASEDEADPESLASMEAFIDSRSLGAHLLQESQRMKRPKTLRQQHQQPSSSGSDSMYSFSSASPGDGSSLASSAPTEVEAESAGVTVTVPKAESAGVTVAVNTAVPSGAGVPPSDPVTRERKQAPVTPPKRFAAWPSTAPASPITTPPATTTVKEEEPWGVWVDRIEDRVAASSASAASAAAAAPVAAAAAPRPPWYREKLVESKRETFVEVKREVSMVGNLKVTKRAIEDWQGNIVAKAAAPAARKAASAAAAAPAATTATAAPAATAVPAKAIPQTDGKEARHEKLKERNAKLLAGVRVGWEKNWEKNQWVVKEEEEDVDDSPPAPAAAVHREVKVERPSAAYKRAAETESAAAAAVHREVKVEVAEKESESKKLKSRLADVEREQEREQEKKRRAEDADRLFGSFSDTEEDDKHGMQHWTKEQWQAWDADSEPAEEEDKYEEDKHGMRHWTNDQWQAWRASSPADPDDEETAPWPKPKRGRHTGNQRKDAKGIPKEVQLEMRRVKKEQQRCEAFTKEVQLEALQEEIRERQLALGLSEYVAPWRQTSRPWRTTYPPKAPSQPPTEAERAASAADIAESTSAAAAEYPEQ